MKINVISLGCSKNLVDTELLMKQLAGNGIEVVAESPDPEADVVIINTCGFIGDAKEESVNTILEQAALKEAGLVGRILVMGCLAQRYREELLRELPEVDAFFGKFEWKNILPYLEKTFDEKLRNSRMLTTPSHYAYLKIAEGCNRHCSYCAIPLMTGEYRSREMEDILEECRELVKSGVRELLILAQDLTYYGVDLYGSPRIAELTEKIAELEGVKWIRLHYAYPAGFPMDLLPVMREKENVCKYLDIALQHISDPMLKKMRRGITRRQTIDLLNTIRREVPGIFLRTTLMTGHPGETEEDFRELCNFVREMRFERLGVFPYSHEEDTFCDKNYADDVPDDVKKERAEKIMEIQREIAADINASLVGKELTVIVDRIEDGVCIGRTAYDSPEVDPEVVIRAATLPEAGSFCRVKITAAGDYDLEGELIG